MFKIMFELGYDVLRVNNMEKLIYIIYKKLIEMIVGKDILKQVFLVVIEIFDCGFFGEGIFIIVEYVWFNLLIYLLENLDFNVKFIFKVIFGGVVFYVMVIMCDDIRN